MAENENINQTASRVSFGREEILFCVDKADESNIVELVDKALMVHSSNQLDIQYLYDYCKGKQPILNRIKKVRPEICNKVVVNRALEIVNFKLGYQVGEPIQYVNRSEVEEVNDEISLFNDMMFLAKKHSKDLKLTAWLLICGIAYRMILPNKTMLEDESEFKVSTLDPRYTFVAKRSNEDKDPLFSCMLIIDADGKPRYCVYTANRYFEIKNNKIEKNEPHTLRRIPIIEYRANDLYLGAFEPVIPLLDAINTTYSNAVDGIEQFVQSLMKFVNVDISEEDFESLKELGAIKLKSTSTDPADVSYLNQPLSQADTLRLTDAMYKDVLTIVMMPNRNGGTSTSDTGNAVIMRDGWESAEAYAKNVEIFFKESELEFLKIALHIARTRVRDFRLSLKNIDTRFTRRNYENIASKAQVLTQMLSNDKIHPLLAFTYSNMFSDPGAAYSMSKTYEEKRQADALKELEEYEEGLGGKKGVKMNV